MVWYVFGYFRISLWWARISTTTPRRGKCTRWSQGMFLHMPSKNASKILITKHTYIYIRYILFSLQVILVDVGLYGLIFVSSNWFWMTKTWGWYVLFIFDIFHLRWPWSTKTSGPSSTSTALRWSSPSLAGESTLFSILQLEPRKSDLSPTTHATTAIRAHIKNHAAHTTHVMYIIHFNSPKICRRLHTSFESFSPCSDMLPSPIPT